MRTTARLGLGILCVATAACDGLLGINLVFVDASAPDATAHDAGAGDAGTKDAPVDATTHDATAADAPPDTRVPDAHPPADAGRDAPPCSPNLETDPDNCGRCGHSCLGGQCIAGTCQPKPVSSPQTLTGVPNFLVVAGGKVFWTQGGQAGDYGAFYATSSGGDAFSVTVDPLSTLGWGIQTDGVAVYFVSIGQGVFVCPFPGCGPDAGIRTVANTNAVSGPIPWTISGIGLGSGVIYVTSNYAVGTNSGFLTRCDHPGDAASCTNVLPNQEPTTNSPVVVDGGVLLAFEGASFAGGSIATCPATGACGTNLYLDQMVTSPQYLTADTTRAYWTEWTGQSDAGVTLGRVMGCVRGNCPLTALIYASDQAKPEGIATDGVYVYWANISAPSVLACPVAGCPDGGPIVLAADAATGGAPFQVALDDAGVYWTNTLAAGTIVRVAKP